MKKWKKRLLIILPTALVLGAIPPLFGLISANNGKTISDIDFETFDDNKSTYNDQNLATLATSEEVEAYLKENFDTTYLKSEDLNNVTVEYKENTASVNGEQITFTVTVTPIDGYTWDDGTTDPKEFTVYYYYPADAEIYRLATIVDQFTDYDDVKFKTLTEYSEIDSYLATNFDSSLLSPQDYSNVTLAYVTNSVNIYGDNTYSFQVIATPTTFSYWNIENKTNDPVTVIVYYTGLIEVNYEFSVIDVYGSTYLDFALEEYDSNNDINSYLSSNFSSLYTSYYRESVTGLTIQFVENSASYNNTYITFDITLTPQENYVWEDEYTTDPKTTTLTYYKTVLATILADEVSEFSDYTDDNLKILSNTSDIETYLSSNLNWPYLTPNEYIRNVSIEYVANSITDNGNNNYSFKIQVTPVENSYWDTGRSDSASRTYTVNYIAYTIVDEIELTDADEWGSTYTDSSLDDLTSSDLESYLSTNYDVTNISTNSDLSNLTIEYVNYSATINGNIITFNVSVTPKENCSWSDGSNISKIVTITYYQKGIATVLTNDESNDSFTDYDDNELKKLTDTADIETYLAANFDVNNLIPTDSIKHATLTFNENSVTIDENYNVTFTVTATPDMYYYWDNDKTDNSDKTFNVNYTTFIPIDQSLSFNVDEYGSSYSDSALESYDNANEINTYLTSNFSTSYLDPSIDTTGLDIVYEDNSVSINDYVVTFTISVTPTTGYMWSEALDQSTKTYTIYYYQTYATIIDLENVVVIQNAYDESSNTDGINETLTFENINLSLNAKNNKLIYYDDEESLWTYEVVSITGGNVIYKDDEFVSDKTYDVESESGYDVTSFTVSLDDDNNYVVTLSFYYNNIAFEVTSVLDSFNDPSNINTFNNLSFSQSSTNTNLFNVTKTIVNSDTWTTENEAYDFAFGFRETTSKSNHYFYDLLSGSLIASSEYTKSNNIWSGYFSFSFDDTFSYTNHYYSSNSGGDTSSIIEFTTDGTTTFKIGSSNNISSSSVTFSGNATYSTDGNGSTTLTSIGWYKSGASSASMSITWSSDYNKIKISGGVTQTTNGYSYGEFIAYVELDALSVLVSA